MDEQPPTEIFDPEVSYTPTQRRAMNKVARDAAVAEWRSDPNRTDPKHTQDRMDGAVHELRVRMGLEK
ncbi:MAG TPA: hypothetical protein VFI34_11425 [Candidatus Limnocylindrales bacterium]|nr:hypothetical protein [Candidatus Limnocylindrales bacterium]